MIDPLDFKDIDAMGGNPCLEQTLHNFEMCTLVETFPHNHETLEEYKSTLQSAFLYAKTVTLGLSHQPETSEVMRKNRRIGASMSGIAQFVASKGEQELIRWCDQSYKYLKQQDVTLSHEFNVNTSIKITSVKPSGTVSLLAGATPGVHFPLSRYYIR